MADPIEIVDVSEFTDPVHAPGTGQVANQSTFALPIQDLANRTRHLHDRLEAIQVLGHLEAPYDAEYGVIEMDLGVYKDLTVSTAITAALQVDIGDSGLDGLEGSIVVRKGGAGALDFSFLTSGGRFVMPASVSLDSGGEADSFFWIRYRLVTLDGEPYVLYGITMSHAPPA